MKTDNVFNYNSENFVPVWQQFQWWRETFKKVILDIWGLLKDNKIYIFPMVM